MNLARKRALNISSRDRRVDAIPWYLTGGVSASDCIAAYQPYGAVTLAGSYVNIANPGTHDLTVGSAPALTANGWLSASADSYLRSDLRPNSNWSVVARVLNIDNGYAAGRIFGVSDGTTKWGIAGVCSGYAIRYWNGPADEYGVIYDPCSNPYSGVVALSGQKAFRDGASEGTISPAGTIPNIDLWIMSCNGQASTFLRGTIMLLAFYSTTLTDEQIIAISTTAASWSPSLIANSNTDWVLTA